MRRAWTCETCGSACEGWEVRCTRCAMATVLPEGYVILCVGPSFLYRLAHGVKGAAVLASIGVAVFAGALFVEYRVFPAPPSHPIWSAVRVIVALLAIAGTLFCLVGAYLSLAEIRTQTTVSITKLRAKFSTIYQIPGALDEIVPAETKLIEGDLELKAIRRVRVVRSWLARHLGYGDIALFAGDGPKPDGVIAGVVKPEIVKRKLEMIIAGDVDAAPGPKSASFPAAPAIRNLDHAPVRKPPRKVRLLGLGFSVGGSVALAALIWVGGWYRATIDDWDDCIRNNKCFVCHRPAEAQEGMELVKNVRLCPDHSTGWQSWRWVVYGVPAIMLVYQDAPMGAGWLFTHLMRWIFIAAWAVGYPIAAGGILLGLTCLLIPKAKLSRGAAALAFQVISPS